uniref:Uncharacterized protein n=1 Tax=Eptatretus burgeri TaxID=7764 RepID=A0A8C4NG06_EPTBU
MKLMRGKLDLMLPVTSSSLHYLVLMQWLLTIRTCLTWGSPSSLLLSFLKFQTPKLSPRAFILLTFLAHCHRCHLLQLQMLAHNEQCTQLHESNENGEVVPQFSSEPNCGDLPQDKKLVQYFYNLGVQFYHQSHYQPMGFVPQALPASEGYHFQLSNLVEGSAQTAAYMEADKVDVEEDSSESGTGVYANPEICSFVAPVHGMVQGGTVFYPIPLESYPINPTSSPPFDQSYAAHPTQYNWGLVSDSCSSCHAIAEATLNILSCAGNAVCISDTISFDRILLYTGCCSLFCKKCLKILSSFDFLVLLWFT